MVKSGFWFECYICGGEVRQQLPANWKTTTLVKEVYLGVYDLHIQIFYSQSIFLDERPARLDFVAHQSSENFIG